MKVFADFHHDDLYHSFHLLFEKRLEWELYCPCGPEWYTKGWWNYSIEPRIVHKILVEKEYRDTGKGYSLVENPCHERKMKALTFDQFKEMKFDILISSVDRHSFLYSELQRKFQPRAKLIQHVGNEWHDVDFEGIENFMVSCVGYKLPAGANVIFYHQEFDLDLFSFEPGDPKDPIKSFVNYLPDLKDWRLFQRYEKALPEWEWKSHGLSCRDGDVRPLKKLVEEMKASSFFFHAKSYGDGFGHIIHNAFALGRPPIIRGKWYKGKFAEPLIQDGATCIDLDKHSFEENCALIRSAANPERYKEISRNAQKRFNEIVDYDAEFERIKSFLEDLR